MPETFTNFARNTLNGNITNASTSIVVADGSSFPTSDFYIVIDPNVAAREIIHITSRSGNTLTADLRGQDGTTAQAHTSGAMVVHGVLARHIQAFYDNLDKTLTGYDESFTANATATGSVTVNVQTTNVYELTLTGAVTLTLTSPPSGTAWSLSIITKQDATGGRVITWPASVKWPGGTVPASDTAANAINVWTLMTTNGGTTWYGFLAGKGLA